MTNEELEAIEARSEKIIGACGRTSEGDAWARTNHLCDIANSALDVTDLLAEIRALRAKQTHLTREQIVEDLADLDAEIILADGFEDALVGVAERCASEPVAVYDLAKMIDVLVKRDGMTHEEADEYISFNVLGAYIGEQTPWIITRTIGDAAASAAATRFSL